MSSLPSASSCRITTETNAFVTLAMRYRSGARIETCAARLAQPAVPARVRVGVRRWTSAPGAPDFTSERAICPRFARAADALGQRTSAASTAAKALLTLGSDRKDEGRDSPVTQRGRKP